MRSCVLSAEGTPAPPTLPCSTLSFGSLDGGALYEHWPSLTEEIALALSRWMRGGQGPDSAGPGVAALLGAAADERIERQAHDEDGPGDDPSEDPWDVHLNADAVSRTVPAFLELAGGGRVSESIVEGDFPGVSSAMGVFARKPNKVTQRCRAMLLASLKP